MQNSFFLSCSRHCDQGLIGRCGSSYQPNWQMVSTVLAAGWDLVLFLWNSMTTDFRKSQVIILSFIWCTNRNSQLFRNVYYCNSAKITSLTESTLSGVHTIESLSAWPGTPTSWIPFQIALNNLAYLLTFFNKSISVHITHSSVNFTTDTPLFITGIFCLICCFYE